MREILFRGKRTDTGEWVYGFYGIKNATTHTKEQHCIMQSTMDARCDYSYFTDIEVDPETVGQFTGLTDKNGTRIFEGDIVKYGDTYAVIEYDVVCYDGYVVYGFAMCTKYGFVPSYDFEGANVIGNIHDNPELLEE